MAHRNTEILSIGEVHRAARILSRGGLVVFPTETVWGLGADARNREACCHIFEAKGRPQDNPLIVHVADTAILSSVAQSLCPAEEAMIEAFMPGPLTLVVPRSSIIPEEVTAGLPDVGVRMPREPTARALLRECGFPVAAPSANRSGKPSPTTLEMARAAMWGRVDAIIEGPPCEVGLESTVVRVRDKELHILRPGAVTPEQLARAVPGLTPVYSYLKPRVGAPCAPGLKYPHYKPRAKVVVVDRLGELIDLAQVVHAEGTYGVLWPASECTPELLSNLPGNARVRAYEDIEAYARQLFSWFHELDAHGALTIIARLPDDHGLGRALRNRLLKAAGGVAV